MLQPWLMHAWYHQMRSPRRRRSSYAARAGELELPALSSTKLTTGHQMSTAP